MSLHFNKFVSLISENVVLFFCLAEILNCVLLMIMSPFWKDFYSTQLPLIFRFLSLVLGDNFLFTFPLSAAVDIQ